MHLHDIFRLELDKRFGTKPLTILETGCIRGRGEASEIGDGYSTKFFASLVASRGGRLTSIDLNTKTVPLVLTPTEMERVTLYEAHSIQQMAALVNDRHDDYDVVFLDSGDDPTLILHEFFLAEQLVRDGGIIVVDDVRMPHHTEGEPTLAHKGDLVWPWVQKHGYEWRIHERIGWATYKTGVLFIEPKVGS